MALSTITFERTTGNLARPLPGKDHISGLLFYGAKPVEFGSADVVEVFTIDEAEALGITEANYPVQHYHVAEFFRIGSGAKLYIGIFPAPDELTAHDFEEVATMQAFAGGELRQVGVYTQKAFAVAQIAALQAICARLEGEDAPLSAILTANIAGQTLAGLPDLTASAAKNVSVMIGQDGNGKGSQLFASQAKTIGAVGAALGAVARAAVNENIGWVAKFDVSGAELDAVAFGEGTQYRTVSKTQLNELDDKGYIFLMKYTGRNGSYFNGAHTASTGDYNGIELNRTIDKAIRGVRQVLLPFLNSPLRVNASGQLSQDTIAAIKAEGNRPLNQMARAGELSGAVIEIDPAQDVLSTSVVQVSIRLLGTGLARKFSVKTGYTTSLS
jgi:hypothetical protein